MEYGVCCGPDLAGAVKAAGFDYYESTVDRLLCPDLSPAEFDRRRAAHGADGLPCPVCHVLFVREVRLVGPRVDEDAFWPRMDTLFARAVRAGVDTVVLGAASSRRVPDGFPRDAAWEQLVHLARGCGERAEALGIVLAVEPINRSQTNMFTSLAEAATFAVVVDRPAVGVMVDAFHWARERGPVEDIVHAGGRLVHAHIATYANRQAPGGEACDFAGFFRGLALAGYDRRLSVEGGLPESADALPAVLAAMRDGLAAARSSITT